MPLMPLMIRTSLTALLFACSTSFPTWAQEASGPAPNIPELKVLNRFTGKWEGQDESGRPTTTATCQWVLGGRFVRQNYQTSNGVEGMIMRGYDPNGRRYVMTMFDSSGTALMLVGQWNEAAKALEMKAPLQDATIVVTMTFPDDDTEMWKIATTDAQGNEVTSVGGKNVRVK